MPNTQVCAKNPMAFSFFTSCLVEYLNAFRTKYTRTEDLYTAIGAFLPSTFDSAAVAAYAIDDLFNQDIYPSNANFSTKLVEALRNIGKQGLDGAYGSKLNFDENHDFVYKWEAYNYALDTSKDAKGFVDPSGKVFWYAGKKAEILWPAQETVAKVTSQVPKDFVDPKRSGLELSLGEVTALSPRGHLIPPSDRSARWHHWRQHWFHSVSMDAQFLIRPWL